MRWQSGRRSDNVEDRRGMGRPLVFGGGIISTIALVVMWLLGGPSDLGGGQAPDPGTGGGGPAGYGAQANDQAKDFISVVLADTEDTWPQVLRVEGVRYQPPQLVLFTDAVDSACGMAQSAVGPFYCPRDAKVYLDLGFFHDLERLGAPGDFAQAYVLAHEVGHHVQNLLGVSERAQALERRGSRAEANAVSVRVELQADCYAGVWAHHAQQRKILEPGDVEEGLQAAASIGDDRLQRRSRGYVAPESFTHGSSAQRLSWFKRGLEAGTTDACDTFGERP